MRIEIETTVKQKKTVDVEFPLFFENSDSSDGGWWNVLTRLAQDGSTLTLTKRGDYGMRGEEWQISTGQVSLTNYGGYLNDDAYSSPSTAQDFAKAVSEFRAFCDKVVPA
jgi:hypothetical protein